MMIVYNKNDLSILSYSGFTPQGDTLAESEIEQIQRISLVELPPDCEQLYIYDASLIRDIWEALENEAIITLVDDNGQKTVVIVNDAGGEPIG